MLCGMAGSIPIPNMPCELLPMAAFAETTRSTLM